MKEVWTPENKQKFLEEVERRFPEGTKVVTWWDDQNPAKFGTVLEVMYWTQQTTAKVSVDFGDEGSDNIPHFALQQYSRREMEIALLNIVKQLRDEHDATAKDIYQIIEGQFRPLVIPPYDGVPAHKFGLIGGKGYYVWCDLVRIEAVKHYGSIGHTVTYAQMQEEWSDEYEVNPELAAHRIASKQVWQPVTK